jgi:hypothetical protein
MIRPRSRRVSPPSPQKRVIVSADRRVPTRPEQGMSRWRALEPAQFLKLIASPSPASRSLGTAVLGLWILVQTLHGQGLLQYRAFQLGGTLAAVSTLAGVSAADAKIITDRPALMQDLEWRRPYLMAGTGDGAADPVQRIVFSFYNDQLFRLAIDYDRDRIEGMTDVDLIDAISAIYGPTMKPAPRAGRTGTIVDDESGREIARWAAADFSAVLSRPNYSMVRMIITVPRLDSLARAARAQARRLDERDAPQREIDRQKKEANDARVAQQKARLANKAAFRP